MKKNAAIVLFTLLLLMSFSGYAQWSHIRFQLAGIKKQGDLLWKKKKYASAIQVYQRVYEKDSSNIVALKRLAECNRLLRRSAQAEYWYARLLERNKKSADILYTYAELLLQNGNVEKAREYFEFYLKEKPNDSTASRKWKYLKTTDHFYEDSLCYTLTKAAFNSAHSDAGTLIMGDSLVFCSARERNALIQYRYASDSSFTSRLYSVHRGEKSSGVKLFTSISENKIPTVWDSCRKFVIDVLHQKKGEIYSGLHFGEVSNKNWKRRNPLPFCIPGVSFKQPYFYEAENTLYFISDKSGGSGGWDIYKSIFENGIWSEPINLGSTINTEQNEFYPFVSSDGILFFSSNGHPGLGGLDIFSVDLKLTPVEITNPGYPINSHQDDFSLVLNPALKIGYLSSNRERAGNDDNIYEIELHTQALEINVLDQQRKIPQSNAIVKISEQRSGKTVRILKTNKQGTVNVILKPGKRYWIEIIKENFRVARMEYYSEKKDTVYPVQEVLLEKVNKSFMRATIVSDSVAQKSYSIKTLDYYSDEVRQVQSDANGQFYCEINPDTTNLFFIRENGVDKIFKLESIRKKRNSLQSTGGNIHFEPIEWKTITGLARDSLGRISGGDTLVIVNVFSEDEILVVTNAKGHFELNLWALGKYKVYGVKNNKRFYRRSFATEFEDVWELEGE